MSTYSKDELDARIQGFMNKKMEQFPHLRKEQYYIESIEKLKPVEREGAKSRSYNPVVLQVAA